jgi:hypothetical protein
MDDTRRTYLRIGEHVTHVEHPEWGIGIVTETLDSAVPGGLCMVRIEFAHAGKKSFFNDLSLPQCCYHAGIKRLK